MAQEPQIILTGYIDIPDGRLDEVAAALPAHISLTRAEPGCLFFDVTEDKEHSGRFNVSERFATRADFDGHQIRMKSSPWAKVTANIPRHYRIEEVPA